MKVDLSLSASGGSMTHRNFQAVLSQAFRVAAFLGVLLFLVQATPVWAQNQGMQCPPNVNAQCLAGVPPCPTNVAQFIAQGGVVGGGFCNTNLTHSCSDGEQVGGLCSRIFTRTHR